ncbi:hypothetical protein [Microbispora sp. NBC_01389]|uniref:hypothetical protein n=1 Tax=Microbispora sp. NBC_01389 TaxID=2903584 RepID=UPI003248F7A3
MIEDLITDPSALLSTAYAWLETHLWHVIAFLVGLDVGQLLVGQALVRLRHWPWSRGARCVEILAPPVADMPGAEALWGNLIGLLRPAWKRVLFGQPHLAFEYVFGVGGVTIRLWVPGVIPQHLVEHAIEAAWPSARTEVREATPPVPLTGLSYGGQLKIARTERLPIRHDHNTDPIRALVGAAVGMPTWQRAAVQILIRPATGRRLISAINGGPAGLVRAVLDLLTPGPSHQQLHPQHLRQYLKDRAAQLEESAEARAIRDKALQPRYVVAVRYAVQADLPTSGDEPARKAARAARRNASEGEHTRSLRRSPCSPGTTGSNGNTCPWRPRSSRDGASAEDSCSPCPSSRDSPIFRWTSRCRGSNGPAPTASRPHRRSRTAGSTRRCSAAPTRGTNGRSPCASPIPSITCTSSARTAPGSRRCSPR